MSPTRRDFLRSAAALAAAASLPVPELRLEPVGPDAPSPISGEEIHDALCFHRKWGALDEDRQSAHAAWVELRETLTPRQWELLNVFDVDHGNGWVNEQDRFVGGLCWHFPGLAPAIRAVAYHVSDTHQAERATCCWPEHVPA